MLSIISSVRNHSRGPNGPAIVPPAEINWTAVQTNNLPSITGALNQWRKGAYGNGYYVIDRDGYDPGAWAYSTDGLNWTVSDAHGLGGRGIVYGNKIFVRLNHNSNRRVDTNPEIPITTNMFSNAMTAGVYGNGIWVLIKTNSIYVSTNDATSWTQYVQTYPVPTGIAYGNGYFVMICRNTTSCFRSTDGITWTLFPVTSSNYSHIVYEEVSSMFVAVSPTAILTMTDNPPTMAEYKEISTNFDARNLSVTSGGGVVVIVGGNDSATVKASTIVVKVNPIRFTRTDHNPSTFTKPMELVMSNPDTQQFVAILRMQPTDAIAHILTAPWPV